MQATRRIFQSAAKTKTNDLASHLVLGIDIRRYRDIRSPNSRI